MNNIHEQDGETFVVTQLLTAFTGGDFMTILGSSLTRLQLLSVSLQQITTGSAYPLAVEVYRGTTSTGTGGATVTPVNVAPWARSAATSVLGPPSAGNSTASASRVEAGGFALGDGSYEFCPNTPVLLSPSQNMHLRTSTAISTAASMNLAVAAMFREVGKMPL